jgi:O-acetyl-ADP-ribose deacetylase (regulator of RNase III)
MPTIVFFDQNEQIIKQYENILKDISSDIVFINATLDEIVNKYYKTNPFILVSPANSYGDMNGGIDKSIIDKFPLVKQRVLNMVKKSPYVDSSFRPYVPVGVANFVELDDKHNILIMAPTMLTPRNIVGTNNVYLAFSAIYKDIKMLDNSVIVACPCLGTGIGGLTGEESAKQILRTFGKK